MKQIIFFTVISLSIAMLAFSPKSMADSTIAKKIKEDSVSYSCDGVTMKGFVYYDAKQKKKGPAIIVVHEWWGLNGYAKSRAKQLAELGYVAMAIDLYGNGETANSPDKAQVLATALYSDPQMAHKRFEAAMTKLKSYAQVDSDKIAAIGYCFGGAQVITMARLGSELKGIVSFHGSLPTGIPTKKENLHAKMLICNGEADKFVSAESIEAFKTEMTDAGVDFTFINYPNAVHAFTNPDATVMGAKFNMAIAYNEAADKKSWEDMKTFLDKLFK